VTGEAPVLGILQLENRPLALPGSLGHPATFAYPTRGRIVPGARVDTVVGGDTALAEAYVEGARALARDGATAITTNCGFTVLYQARLSAAVGIPVATSSLLLLPFMAAALAPGRAIGLVTYDAGRLTPRHLAAAGAPAAEGRIVTAGIEGSRSWAALADPEPDVTVDSLATDVLAAVRALLVAHPEVACLLLECAAFCPVAPRVRAETGRPVFDFVTLADLVMATVPRGRPGRE
jgi:Asp/Glu/hydantoin racemase